MAYFIVRLFVNAFAVALTIWIVPGISVEPVAERQIGLVFAYLVLGLVFGLINAFIRPLVLFITGRLLIWTMGLFTLVINGFLFYLISFFIPGVMIIQSPVLLNAILAGAMMGISVTILEAIFGLDSPVIDGDSQHKFYWRWLGRLSTGRRNAVVENLRLQQVYATIRRYGLDILVGYTPLASFRRRMQGFIYPDSKIVLSDSAPVSTRKMLEELGPTYVKLGQMIASRSEILPDAWRIELSQLQDQVSAFPYEQVQRIVTQELGASPEELFTSFETKPLAAASMAQTHRATLPSGEQVVVKVQRPDIDVTVKGDLNVIRNVVATTEMRATWARNLGLSGMLDEFAENVIEELNYENEAYQARRLKDTMGLFDYVHVPAVYSDYSTSKVLTMEYVEGVKITAVDSLDEAGMDRDELAHMFLRVMNQQVLLDGFFHGDPHPGNVWFNPSTGKIIFLDLGMMGQMSDLQRLALFDIIWSLNSGDSEKLTKILLRLSTHTKPIDRDALERDVDRLVQRYVIYADGVPRLAGIVQEALALLFNYSIILHRSLTLALKGLMQAEEIVRTLAPGLSFLEAAVEEVQNVLVGQLEGEVVYEKAKNQLVRTAKNVVVGLPSWQRAISNWAEQLQSEGFSLHLDTGDLNQQIEQLDKSIDRNVRHLVVGLLLVGMLLGSAIVSLVPVEKLIYLDFLPFDLFVVVFIVAVVFAMGYILYAFWRFWRDRRG